MKLNVENLSANRGEQTIFAHISFQLTAGDALIVTGTNGSGKSTLLRVIAGLLPNFSGNMVVEGGIEDKPIAEYCHYLGHQNALKPTMSVAENLLFWQQHCGTPDLEITEALQKIDLAGTYDIPIAYLSAGQKRRIAIARLLVTKRQIWLVDEPTAALDAKSEAMFSNLLQTHMASGGIVIAATHQPLGLKNTKNLDMDKHQVIPELLEDEYL